jgi:hypothetical protein
VSVAGEAGSHPEQDADGNVEWIDHLAPFYMGPPPPIISIPLHVPDPARSEIILSFQLYWVDCRVCASRLRTSLERLMDHFGVAKTRIQQDNAKPNKPGKRVPLDLSARINKLAKKVGTPDFSEILHAPRKVGNVGVHGAKVTQSAMLDAFQLYEWTLEKLFEDKNETPKAIIKRLKAHKLK